MKQENPLLNILINIVLPVMILHKGSRLLGGHSASLVLLVALALPIGYAIYDYRRRKTKNWMSAIGAFNILLTGGLALLHLQGFWFALKEAIFPSLLGLGVLISAFSRRPIMEILAFHPHMLNVEKIRYHIEQNKKEQEWRDHLKISTLLFSSSFFISATGNFLLARRVFLEIPKNLSENEQTQILNGQIAHMTTMSFVVILLPLMLFSGLVFWHLFRGIRKLTGLSFDDILPDEKLHPQGS